MESSVSDQNTSVRRVEAKRFLIILIGAITVHMFFFNFIALVIGILGLVFFKDNTWKRHGFFLALFTGIGTVVAHRGTGHSPLFLALFFGTIPFVIYFGASLIWDWWLKHRLTLPVWISRVEGLTGSLSRRLRGLLLFLLILSPVLLWSSMDINLGVMFNNESQLLWIHAPSTADIGEDFDIIVEAWDSYERLSATYKGQVTFSIESYNLTTLDTILTPTTTLPEPYSFTGQMFGSDVAYWINDGQDNGLHVFSASIDTPGIHYLLVEDSVTGNTYYSNPILVQDYTESDPRIYWGDIHGHTMLSDGSGWPDDSYYYGRYVAGLEYCAITDHTEIMMWVPGSFDALEAATNAAYDPDHYVTFHGFEWTQTTTGHYTCIFDSNELLKDPVVSYLYYPTTDMLWGALDDFTESTSARALALPHHTTKNAYIQDWTYINPKYVKIAEVTSVHGTFLFEQRHPYNYEGAIDPPPEYLNGSSIMDAFRMGYRMTLYSSGDQHDGHPGHSLSHTPAFVGHQRPWSWWNTRNEHPYPGGITAVYADGLTRDSIFTGLDLQRIFACSDHGRPILEFSINGTRVGDGSTLYVDDINDARELNIFLMQDGAPAARYQTAASVSSDWIPDWRATIEVFKNGELLTQVPINEPVNRITLLDYEAVTGTSYGSEGCVQIDGEYYINTHSDNPIDPSQLNTGGADFYVVRVVCSNGRMVYAGPIWVETSS
ncbi:MAG: DUF3604 domain-containing protein [Candidatus Thorarchaeota archaeon]